MDRIDNFNKSVNHETPEEIVIDLGGCPLSSMEGNTQRQLLEFLGYAPPGPEEYLFGKVQRIDERLLQFLDVDTRSVGEILHPSNSQMTPVHNGIYTDEWGIERKFTGKYWDIVKSPLQGAEREDLKTFRFPEPESVDLNLIENFAKEAKKLSDENKYAVCAEHPVYGVFELGCWLCGFEDFLVKMLIDTDFVRELFEKILEYQSKMIEIYYKAVGPYIHYTSSGDDFATQSNLFFKPEIFDALIRPYLSERIRQTKKFTKAKFLHHSCGNIAQLVPAFIETGVEILNPIQPVCDEMLPENLKSRFGSNIVFHGGVDTQGLLPFGTQPEIENCVKELIQTMNVNGGYIFAAAHNLQEDVPPENIIHLFRAARKYGTKQFLNQ